MIDEAKLIQTIIRGSDWQEVLTSIVIEENMNPAEVDIVNLSEAFMRYLLKLQTFDFRVPGRFILIAAILLRMKCEILLEEEQKKEELKAEEIPALDINVPLLASPLERKPTRKVTLNELITALNKAFELKERKESKEFRMRHAVERLIVPEEDIEIRIKRVFHEILRHGTVMKFSDLVPVWKRKEIVETFLPILYLSNRGKISCDQEEFFRDITIQVK